MKRLLVFRVYGSGHVAPHAGAWIETTSSRRSTVTTGVAPHAGAWIETISMPDNVIRQDVAPHAGAWIETGNNV